MKHLKLFFALFAMLALGVGNVWGQTVTWEKATSIAAGDVVALVCESKKMELSGISTTSTKYGTGVAYTSAPNGKYELTVEAGSSTGTFSFKNGSNYLYWSSGNSLNKTTTKNANASWTVTFSNGNAVIKNANTPARQIYWNASSPRFACYDKTGQTAVQLYKKVISEESEDVIVKTLKSIEVTPKTINYETGDVFKFDGTCTATYSVTKNGEPQADETAVVNPTTVSTPDMSTADTKEITVTYTEDGVTVTDTYEIEVTQNEVTPGAYTGNLNNVFFGCAVGNNATEQSSKFDDVLVVAGCKSSATSKTNYQSDHVRFYADSYLTLSVPTGYVIKSIVFTADGDWKGSITASTGTYTDGTKTWTGNAQEVKFSFAAQNRIKSVKVTYAADVKYAVNITTLSNGTLVVKEGSTVLTDGAQVYEGTKLVVTPTPNAGYVFESLTVGGTPVDLTEGSYNLTMPASNVTVTATFKENEKPAATLTLSKNGETEDITGHKQDDKVTLPSVISGCVKEFVGWSTNPTCNVAPEYAAGDSYTLTATSQTLYAVYATVGGGGETTASVNMATYAVDNSWGSSSSDNQKLITINSDVKAVISEGGNSGKYYDDGVRIYQTESAIITISTSLGELKSVKFTFTNSNSGTLLYGSTTLTSNIAVEVSGTSAVFSVGDTNASENKGQIRFTAIEVTYASAPTYSDYSTTCAAAPKAEVNPTTVSATAAGAEGKVTVTYKNVNTANVSVALFNDAACTEAFTADWLTAALDGDKNIAYTVAATTLYTERKAYIKLTAPETTGATDPAVVVILVTQAAKDKVFASLEELVAAITPTTAGIEVTVTLTNEVIQDFYKSGSYTNGIALNVPYEGGVKVIEIYCKDVPAEWVKGGKVSGTITCPWKLYNSTTWELCPNAWTELTYTAPATVSSIAVSGNPTKTTYIDGEKFDPAGLVVTATYSDASTGAIDAALVDWTFDPATLVKGQTSVKVTAKFNSVSSAAHEVTGLTVNDIPTKTVAEFIAARGTRCYLEGVVSGLTEGNSMKYGNFDLTDASGTIYVYGCLNASGEKEKFAELDVKNGDKIKVIADELTVYNSKDQAKNVQYVSHISAATITIANISMEVNEVKTISATLDPAEAEVTYTIKENTANAISLSGNTITAKEVGTATITATVAEGADYLANSVDFTVTVNPQNIAVLPFEFDKGKNDIASTLGMTQEGLGSDYTSSPKLKFDDKDDYLIVHFDSEPGELSYTIKANVNSGDFTGEFDVQVSENGDDYDVLVSYTELEKTAAQKTHKLDKNVRYVKFVYTNKVSGQNVALGNILISKLSVLRADLYDGKWGTFCPDQKVTYMQGASFYTLTYLEMKDGMPYKLFFDEITTDYLEAGKPYLFIAEGEEIKGVKSGEVVSIASNYNGFYGNVSGNTISLTTTQTEYVADGDVVNNYGVINSRFTLLGKGTNVAHERAHVQIKNGQLDCPNPPASLPALAPGARRVVAGATGINTATGVDQVQGDNVPTKMIINGQLYILRGEKMYDAQGKLVK